MTNFFVPAIVERLTTARNEITSIGKMQHRAMNPLKAQYQDRLIRISNQLTALIGDVEDGSALRK